MAPLPLPSDSADSSAEVDTGTTTPPDGSGGGEGGNPAWADLRAKLDPEVFKTIEPDLKNWDTSVQKRIEDSNKQYSWAKDLAQSGVTPAQIQQALVVAKAIDENPLEVHEALGTFLQNNGRLPNKQELKQEVQDNRDDDGQVDPRFSQLEEQQRQMMEFLAEREQSSQQAAAEAQAAAQLDADLADLKKAHPNFGDDDVNEILNRAYAATVLAEQRNQPVPTLEEVAQGYLSLQNRIRTAPRASDTAPRLLPTGGGVATSSGEKKSVGQLSRNETQKLVEDLLSGGAL